MINENKFNEIFQPIDNDRKLGKKRALDHYRGEADKAIAEAMINNFKSSGLPPGIARAEIIAGNVAENVETQLGTKITDGAHKSFIEWLEDEAQRVGDFD